MKTSKKLVTTTICKIVCGYSITLKILNKNGCLIGVILGERKMVEPNSFLNVSTIFQPPNWRENGKEKCFGENDLSTTSPPSKFNVKTLFFFFATLKLFFFLDSLVSR